MLDFDDGLPVEGGRIAEDVQGRRRGALEDDVKPGVLAEAFGVLNQALAGRLMLQRAAICLASCS